MKTWELYQDFKKQDVAGQQLAQKYASAVQAASEEVDVAVHEYNRILNLEFAGENVQDQKKEALQAIESAKAALEVANNEYRKVGEFTRLNSKRITSKDLAIDWNDNVCPSIRKEQLQPIVDRMREGLQTYYSGLLEFYALEELYRHLQDELGELERKRPRAAGESYFGIRQVATLNDVPKPSNSDLAHVANNRTLPNGYTLKGDK
jgi:hypothetical protein